MGITAHVLILVASAVPVFVHDQFGETWTLFLCKHSGGLTAPRFSGVARDAQS
jgi:hypothetical protein